MYGLQMSSCLIYFYCMRNQILLDMQITHDLLRQIDERDQRLNRLYSLRRDNRIAGEIMRVNEECDRLKRESIKNLRNIADSLESGIAVEESALARAS